jgi:hypothetical protein
MLRRLAPAFLLVALVALLIAAPAAAQLRYVGDKGVAVVGKVSCQGPACAVAAPKRVRVQIGGERFWAKVLAPRRIPAGGEARVRVRFGAGALARLAGKSTTVKVRLTLRQGRESRSELLKIRLRRAALPNAPAGPISGPLSPEPPLLARPLTAVDVSAVQVTWHPRDSWVRYVSSEESILFGNGASGVNSEQSPCPYDPANPAKQAPPGLPFTAQFAAKPSWYDPVSGVAGIYGQGDVQFRYSSRGIDLTASDPEIEINGAASRAIFRFNGAKSTPIANRRAPLVDLDLSGQPAVTNGGKTFSYSLMRGALTADGVNVFAGFYQQGSNFGCVSVSFTTP